MLARRAPSPAGDWYCSSAVTTSPLGSPVHFPSIIGYRPGGSGFVYHHSHRDRDACPRFPALSTPDLDGGDNGPNRPSALSAFSPDPASSRAIRDRSKESARSGLPVNWSLELAYSGGNQAGQDFEGFSDFSPALFCSFSPPGRLAPNRPCYPWGNASCPHHGLLIAPNRSTRTSSKVI